MSDLPNSNIEWRICAGTPRHHGLGKLQLCIESLAASNSDIRNRLLACIADFNLATISLRGTLPPTIESEMDDVNTSLVEVGSTFPQQSSTSPLFSTGGGGNIKGVKTATALVHRIFSVYTDIHRYDAVASLHEVGH
ncbi:MAG: hypothetical protein ACKVHE_07630 [Planctomycetales bacterium]|jgi:hypothetical protein